MPIPWEIYKHTVKLTVGGERELGNSFMKMSSKSSSTVKKENGILGNIRRRTENSRRKHDNAAIKIHCPPNILNIEYG